MARTVVTGATGFVGGRLVRRLRDAGEQVVAVVRRPSEELDRLGVAQHRAGLTDVAALADLLTADDAIVHAAASIGPDLETARRVNRDGTAAVATAAARADVRRLVHVSTTSVYDRSRADNPVGEDAPLVADGPPYAVTKAEAEEALARARDDGLSVAVLRPPAVLGAGPTSTWGARVPARLRAGELSPPPAVQTFAWVHVEDLVDALVSAHDVDMDVTVNVVGGHATWGDYLAGVAAFLPEVAPAAGEAAPESDATDVWTGRYGVDRLPATLGIRPRRPFEAALEEIAAWWRDRGDPEQGGAGGR